MAKNTMAMFWSQSSPGQDILHRVPKKLDTLLAMTMRRRRLHLGSADSLSSTPKTEPSRDSRRRLESPELEATACLHLMLSRKEKK